MCTMRQPSLVTASESQRVCVTVQGLDAFDVTSHRASLLQDGSRENGVGKFKPKSKERAEDDDG